MKLNAVLALEPRSFFEYVKTIRYGYQDRSGMLHFEGDADFRDHGYVFSPPEDVTGNHCGWCWDVANLISLYCRRHNMAHIPLFMEYNTPELHQTHTQVFLYWNQRWCPAPDNSAVFSLGDGGRETFEACRNNYVQTFREYLISVLKDRYAESQLLLKPVTRSIPAYISDEDYLQLVRNC